MERIEVPYGGETLSMTLPAAVQLQSDLAGAIKGAIYIRRDLQAPRASEGFLTHGDVFNFFGQVYTRSKMLDNHAGKLFSRLVRASGAQDGRVDVPFVVICNICGKDGRAHRNDPELMRHWQLRHVKIEVESLKRHAETFKTARLHNVGPTMCADLDLLLYYL